MLQKDGSVLVWSFRTLFSCSEQIGCFNTEYGWSFLRRGISSIFLRGCELTRLWMRCRIDVLGLVTLLLRKQYESVSCSESSMRSSKCRAHQIPDADHLPLCLRVLKLVCVEHAHIIVWMLVHVSKSEQDCLRGVVFAHFYIPM